MPFKKGYTPYNKGIKGISKGSAKGTIPWNKGKLMPEKMGANNPAWKGDAVGYSGIHMWIKSVLGNANHCSFNRNHLSTKYVWANISGSYLRDINDWAQLCSKCHNDYDWIRAGKKNKPRDENGRFTTYNTII